MDINKKDLKYLKLKSYIDSNPEKPFGYYILGEFYLYNNDIKNADINYEKAISINENYIRGVIGLITLNILSGNNNNAYKLYRKYKDVIYNNRFFKKLLCKKVINSLVIDKTIREGFFHKIKKYFNNKKLLDNYISLSDDLMLILINTINIVKEDIKVSDNNLIYDILIKCVKLPGVNDEFKWNLITILKEYKDLEEKEIEECFETVPQNCDDPIYLNKIFEYLLNNNKKSNINTSYLKVKDKNLFSSQNLWRYISINMEDKNYSKKLYKACSILIKRGWIDSLIAECIRDLERLEIINDTNKEDSFLKLYNYYN